MTTAALSRSTYDTETVERALWALALHAGSPQQASEALAEQGISIAKQTLHRWKTQHAERYEQVRKEASSQIADRIASEAEAFMLAAAETERLALRKLHEQIENDQIKDVSSALRNITTSKALNNDKIASPLRGRPSVVVERRTADEALKRLERLAASVDSSAEEIQDARSVVTSGDPTRGARPPATSLEAPS